MGLGSRSPMPGICPPVNTSELDATITFSDLDQIFRVRGVNVLSQPIFFERVPEERRRHLSASGGLPLADAGGGALLQPEVPEASGTGRAQGGGAGGDGGPAGAGLRGYPLDRGVAGPPAVGAAGGAVLAAGAAGQHRAAPEPVSGGGYGGGRQRRCHVRDQARGRSEPDPEAVAAILDQIGKGPNGRPWDCRACGFHTCQRFAEAAALGRASLRQCTPYQERRADEAQRAAAVDWLTGLSTYRVLRDRLAFEIERSKRSSESFAVLFLDLDRFKQVNDQFGHEAGNDILRAVAEEIRNAVRASDVAARYGGDEFVVILTRTDLQGGMRVAEALRAGIEGIGRRLGYPAGLITVSIGLSEFDPNEPEGDLLVAADRALYRAKAAGRNAVA